MILHSLKKSQNFRWVIQIFDIVIISSINIFFNIIFKLVKLKLNNCPLNIWILDLNNFINLILIHLFQLYYWNLL
jgi:hypothetical protein